MPLGDFAGLNEFILCAPSCFDGAFLVEFTQVPLRGVMSAT